MREESAVVFDEAWVAGDEVDDVGAGGLCGGWVVEVDLGGGRWGHCALWSVGAGYVGSLFLAILYSFFHNL